MRLLVTGGTGFIGRPLVKRLLARGDSVTVYSRRPAAARALFGGAIEAWDNLSSWASDIAFDAVINLAGEPIIDRPWTARRKQILHDSRIQTTRQLVQAMARSRARPAVFASGSAIGIYGDSGQAPRTETCAIGTDFPARLCADWEAAAAEAAGIRTVMLRTGLVLHADGGLLARMHLPFMLGLGGRLGDGSQAMSWIHREDYLNALLFLLDNPDCQGPFNLVAPHPVSNAEFSDALAASYGRRALLRTPAFALKAILGERAALLLGGQMVLPEKLVGAGFAYRYHLLSSALREAKTG